MKISLHSGWRPTARRLIHPGVYRVPEDLPLALAEQAVAERRAVWMDRFSKTGAPENKIAQVSEAKEPRPLAGSPIGEGQPSQSSAADQASANQISTSSEDDVASSQSMTPGASADGPMSSTPATPSGGRKRGRRKKSSER